jgi:hypothetical protein
MPGSSFPGTGGRPPRHRLFLFITIPQGEQNPMGKRLPPPKNPEPIISPAIRHIAGIGLRTPSKLTTKQVQKISASVEAHIEPRGKKKGK